MDVSPYPRDLVGFGPEPPHPRWPGGARLALSFVLNYEEGAENTVFNGDPGSEIYLCEVPPREPRVGMRDLNVESAYEYGARAGVWRLLRLFDEFALPLTVFAVGKALADNPQVGRAFAERHHEVASHHWRWIDYSTVDEDTERDHLRRSVEVIEELCGARPVGFYGGRVSERSRRLAVEAGSFRYDSDAYDDDLPHWVGVDGKDWLVIPYTFDTNDMKFSVAPGFANGEQFFAHLRDSFDELYREGATLPRMMSVGLHCRITGRPGRLAGLRRFLEHVAGFDDVWVCRREEIAGHFYASR